MEQMLAPARRIPLSMGVEFRKSYAREGSSGTLLNLSVTGAYLKTDEASLIQIGEKISVVIQVFGRARKVSAKVVWKNPFGAGVQFIPTNNRDVQIVDDLIYFVENSRTEKKSLLDTIIKKVA